MGVYFGAAYAFTSDGARALSAVRPYSVLPTGAAKLPALVVEDIDRPTTRGAFRGAGVSLGGGGASTGGGDKGRGASATLSRGGRTAFGGGGAGFGSSFTSGGGGGGTGRVTSTITISIARRGSGGAADRRWSSANPPPCSPIEPSMKPTSHPLPPRGTLAASSSRTPCLMETVCMDAPSAWRGRGAHVLLDVEGELGDALALHHVDEPHHPAVGNGLVRADDGPGVLVLGHRLGHLARQLRLGQLRAVEEELPVLVEHHVDQPLHRLTTVGGPGQVHLHRLAHDEVGRHHEDDEQHQHHVHQRRDVDAGDFLVVVLRAAGHG
ncbi:hypothetical protein STIAU_3089 [Stigmatella aurantiaca DW4/3-1]|uniref:Uncharacterized protein n=1 Tax=Stigmatella aurantiaca (strain DW4/3-1) TaxID=378806 RepID=Q097C2_STIAD|nr:hypothetical protein STIAU_3089 [Stigmatella aurantiaca DW4/3-1]